MASIIIPSEISQWINNVLKHVEADVWHVEKKGRRVEVMVNYKVGIRVVKVKLRSDGNNCFVRVLNVIDCKNGTVAKRNGEEVLL